MNVQMDPSGKDPHAPGAKLDLGKAPVWRGFFKYFPDAILRVSMVSLFGATKYTWGGWKTVEDGFARYSDAGLRHMCDEARGEELDLESKIEHAAHAAWNSMARLQKLLDEKNGTNFAPTVQ